MQEEGEPSFEYEDNLPISRLETKRMNLLAVHKHKSVGVVKVSNVEFNEPFSYQNLRKNPEAIKVGKKLLKYYTKRYFFFSLFDKGIQLDTESWYSVVAEPISLYLLSRIQQTTFKRVFQPFCGVGGIAVHLSRYFPEYIVNDIDSTKISMLRNNLDVYGVPLETLNIKNMDFFDIEPFPCDLVLLCPPWGGIDLRKYSTEPLDSIMSPKLSDILLHAKKFSTNIMIQLPKNTNIQSLFNLIKECLDVSSISIDNILLNGKSSQLYVYIGANTLTKINTGGVCEVLYDALDSKSKQQRTQIKNEFKTDSSGILAKIYQKYFVG